MGRTEGVKHSNNKYLSDTVEKLFLRENNNLQPHINFLNFIIDDNDKQQLSLKQAALTATHSIQTIRPTIIHSVFLKNGPDQSKPLSRNGHYIIFSMYEHAR